MALKIVYTRLAGTLLNSISSSATLLPIDLPTLAIITGLVNFAGGEWTYLTISTGNGSFIEEVKAIGVSGNNLVIVRGASMSTPLAFNVLNTKITNIVGLDAIKDIIAATPVTSNVSVTGSGIAQVTNVGPVYNVNVPALAMTGADGVSVTGQYPNYAISLAAGAGGCCGGCGGGTSGGAGVDTLQITSSILQGNILGNILSLSLQTPTFTGAGGLTVTGTYPNFTITQAATGAGTVTSVGGGTGLSLTGIPSVNPTLSITNTGVTAGNYGGVIINAQGQVTAVPLGFSPISSITFDEGITVVIAGGVATCTVADAAVGIDGIVALADSSVPLVPTDDLTAVTPKVLANALASLIPGTQGNGMSTGEADASYTNVIGTTNLTVALAAGKKLALFAECEMLDGGAPLTPVAFGVAIAASAGPVFIYKGKKCTQSRQTTVAVITGPLSDTISLVTTAIPAGATVYSSSLVAIPL